MKLKIILFIFHNSSFSYSTNKKQILTLVFLRILMKVITSSNKNWQAIQFILIFQFKIEIAILSIRRYCLFREFGQWERNFRFYWFNKIKHKNGGAYFFRALSKFNLKKRIGLWRFVTSKQLGYQWFSKL